MDNSVWGQCTSNLHKNEHSNDTAGGAQWVSDVSRLLSLTCLYSICPKTQSFWLLLHLTQFILIPPQLPRTSLFFFARGHKGAILYLLEIDLLVPAGLGFIQWPVVCLVSSTCCWPKQVFHMTLFWKWRRLMKTSRVRACLSHLAYRTHHVFCFFPPLPPLFFVILKNYYYIRLNLPFKKCHFFFLQFAFWYFELFLYILHFPLF